MSATFPRAVARFGKAAIETGSAAARPVPPRTRDLRRPRRRVVVRLWLPATALFWILAPLPLLLAPLAWFAPHPFRPVNPYAAVIAVGRVLIALGGTIVDVDCPDALVRIQLF